MNKTTFMAKPGQVERKWYVIDATDVPLGRLSAVVASVLRGKNKPTFTPHTDTGDFVIVINAEKVKLTGKKATEIGRATSELQSRQYLVCRLLLEKKKE